MGRLRDIDTRVGVVRSRIAEGICTRKAAASGSLGVESFKAS